MEDNNQLFIDNFKYDGRGPDAFFLIGTDGNLPSENNGIILPYPFNGQFYDYSDKNIPILKKSEGIDITLTLPENINVKDLKWISVWCKRFKVNFADLMIHQDVPRF